jgi:hypothetical protein
LRCRREKYAAHLAAGGARGRLTGDGNDLRPLAAPPVARLRAASPGACGSLPPGASPRGYCRRAESTAGVAVRGVLVWCAPWFRVNGPDCFFIYLCKLFCVRKADWQFRYGEVFWLPISISLLPISNLLTQIIGKLLKMFLL